MKNCPYCHEEIQDDAIKCKHCQEFLKGENEFYKKMNAEEKREAAFKILEARGISYKTYAPFTYRMLWKMGINMPPPHMSSFLMNMIISSLSLGFFFFLIYSILYSFLDAIIRGVIGGLFCGLGMAIYYSYSANKHQFPKFGKFQKKELNLEQQTFLEKKYSDDIALTSADNPDKLTLSQNGEAIEGNRVIGLIMAGYSCGIIALFFIPPAFGIAGAVFGILTMKRGEIGHGVSQIIIASSFATFGMIIGSVMWS